MTPPEARNQAAGENAGQQSVSLHDPAVLISLAVAAAFGSYLLLTSTTDPLPFIQWRYDAKRILQFCLLFLLFLVPVLNGRIRLEFGLIMQSVPRWLRLLLLCVFLWGLTSVVFNAQSLMQALNSFSEVALLALIVLGVFVVAACRRTAGRLFDQIAIGLIALMGLAVGIQELIGVVAAEHAGVDFNFRISLLHFSWPRFYNQVQSWTVPALIALPILFARYRMVPALCAVILGLQWYIMIMGSARGSVVSLVAASMFAIIFLPNLRGRVLRWQISGLLVGLVIFAAVLYIFESDHTDQIPEPANSASQTTGQREPGVETGDTKTTRDSNSFLQQSLGKPKLHTSGRMEWWQWTLEDTRENPLLGIGPMNYVCTSPRRIGHPHNFPLQLSAEWGAPVALGVCAIFLYLLWSITRALRQNRFGRADENLVAGLLFTGILAAAIHACVSGIMVMPASQVTGVLIGGILAGLYPQKTEKIGTARAGWVLLPGIVLSAFLLVLGSHELNTMQQREPLLSPGDTMWPRIWQDSKVCSLY